MKNTIILFQSADAPQETTLLEGKDNTLKNVLVLKRDPFDTSPIIGKRQSLTLIPVQIEVTFEW